jgi:hypothetical protein
MRGKSLALGFACALLLTGAVLAAPVSPTGSNDGSAGLAPSFAAFLAAPSTVADGDQLPELLPKPSPATCDTQACIDSVDCSSYCPDGYTPVPYCTSSCVGACHCKRPAFCSWCPPVS